MIENGLKDLIEGYGFDQCPGTRPHHVNVHFFLVTVCKHLYQLLHRELGAFGLNPDGTAKGLRTMRPQVIRPGAGKVFFRENTFEIHFQNRFSPQLTTALEEFYAKVHKRAAQGFDLLGGAKVKFVLRSPLGEEFKNAGKKVLMGPQKKSPPSSES